MYLPENPKLLEAVKALAPWYSVSLLDLPTSVCGACAVYLRKKSTFEKQLKEVKTHLHEGSRFSRLSSASKSDLCEVRGDSCWICSRIRVQPPLKSDSPPPPKKEISPFKRRKRTVITKTVEVPVAASLNVDDILSMQRKMRVSSRTMSRGADQQRSRAASGQTPISSPSGATMRQKNTEINKAFWDDFETFPSRFSSDGCLYRVKALPEWVRKILWIRGKPVSALFVSGEKVVRVKSDILGASRT